MNRKYFSDNLSFIITIVVLGFVIIGGIAYIVFWSPPVYPVEETMDSTRQTKQLEEEQNNNAAHEDEALKRAIDFKYSDKTTLDEETEISDIVKKAGPSVVGIRITNTVSGNGLLSPGINLPLAEGSGIIVSEEGYIITNYHVVQFADPKEISGNNTAIEVFLPDERQARARFIGGDRRNDIAVVKISLDNLPVAELGDSSELEAGDTAVAIGNPLGMDFAGSVTVGVVSALNRIIIQDGVFLELIQTDAAINPGNSGGALVNLHGQVIGINSVKIYEKGVEGLGFAIPVNDAKDIARQLVFYGYVKNRPFSGISGRNITKILSGLFDVPEGVLVTKILPGSGADSAGILQGDILIQMDGTRIKNIKDLFRTEKNHKAGDVISVIVIRGKRRLKFEVRL